MAQDPDWSRAPNQMTAGQMRAELRTGQEMKERSPSSGMPFGLSICKVIRIDYTAHEVELHVLSGEDQLFQRTAIPITYPGAGPRSFLGHIPTVGSLCVCGSLATTPRIPVVLGWLTGGTMAGLEWIPSQKFLPSEVDFNTKLQTEVEGLYNRVRHKLNHARPGMIMASSAMGSDIILDEGVFITNRRANEIRLRDQDQALVVRTLQQFHAMGGARIYGGMVQRDATLLPSTMISDGTQWDAPRQVDENGAPLPQFGLANDPSRPEGVLTPHEIFFRTTPGLGAPDSRFSISSNLDPYNFLKNGLFIGSDGTVLDANQTLSAAEYGGKSIYRVSLPSPGVQNDVVERDETTTLTEYRIELDHIWDGTLPVTEQTDGFDADRLPSEAGDSDNPLSNSAPFIEWVMGSVVGNNAMSEAGRKLYGLPLTPVVFDGIGTNPRLDSAIGLNLNEHAATLFRLTPPLNTNSSPTFTSFLKDGRFRASIAGSPTENSAEIALAGGLKLRAGGPLDLGGSSLKLNFRQGDPVDNFAFAVLSTAGAVKLSAGGPTTEGSFSARTNPDAFQENTLPALLLEAPGGNAHLTAGRIVKIVGNNAIQLTDTNEVTATPKQSFNVYSSKFLCNVTTLDRTVLGQETTAYSGPKNFLPSNVPLRSTKFIGTPLTGHVGGKTDEYRMLLGNRDEQISLGNHSTTVLVGNLTYKAGVGIFTAQAGTNTIKVGTSTGISATSVSTLRMTSTLATTIRGTASVTISSQGTARLSGKMTTLGGVGLVGKILSSTDIDPTSGKPFSFFGLGSPGHRLGSPV